MQHVELRPKGHWQRAHPATATSIGSNDQEPPGQVIATHAYRANACQRQAHHKVSPGHGIGNDGSAPCVPILPWHPETNLQRTSGAPPTHRLQHLTDGQCIWLWRRKGDSSPCPLRVLQGSPDRHSTTNPKQLATKQLATTAAHAATISYNHTHTQDSTATAARRTNQTRGIQQSTGSMAKETSRQRRRRPNQIAIFTSAMSNAWRIPSERQ